jgi:hypothetical protein
MMLPLRLRDKGLKVTLNLLSSAVAETSKSKGFFEFDNSITVVFGQSSNSKAGFLLFLRFLL